MIYDLPRRVKSYYLIPKSNCVTIRDYTWKLNEEKVYLYKGIPHYVLSTENAEPIDPLDTPKAIMTSTDFDVAIGQNVAKQIFLASKGSFNGSLLNTILLGVLIMAIIYIGYTGSELITQLQNDLDAIKNIVGIGG
jgi:hypothetical protein